MSSTPASTPVSTSLALVHRTPRRRKVAVPYARRVSPERKIRKTMKSLSFLTPEGKRRVLRVTPPEDRKKVSPQDCVWPDAAVEMVETMSRIMTPQEMVIHVQSHRAYQQPTGLAPDLCIQSWGIDPRCMHLDTFLEYLDEVLWAH